MFLLVAFCLAGLTLLVNGQTLVSQVYMEGVMTTVTFSTSGSNVAGSFDAQASGLTGTVDVRIHPLWFHYDVSDKCSDVQLGAAITGLTTTTTFGSAFTLSSTSLDQLEGKSLVLEAGGVTACATIQKEGDYITASAYFRNTLFGSIYFRQHSVSSSTFIVSDLKSSVQAFMEGTWFIAAGDIDCNNPGNPGQISHFNPANINGQSCSQNAQSNCAIGSLSAKLGTVQIANTSSSARVSYTDTNLPLSGPNYIINKYLIIYDSSNMQYIACTKIFAFKQISASSTFSHQDVTGRFTFKQNSPFDPTIVSIHLEGLNSLAKGYHVHNWPVPLQSESGQALCAGDVVSGHLNPFGIDVENMYPAPQSSTDDLYEVGDLSSKYGTFEGQNKSDLVNMTDWNLPLFGRNSIIGRSIVIHRDDPTSSRWVCSNIHLNGTVISASAVFTGPVIGQIYFTQVVDSPYTWIFTRLDYIDGRADTTGHMWQVYTEKVGRGSNCTGIGPVYNPTSIFENDNQYETICSSDSRFCKLGDLSGRLGTINIGGSGSNDPRAKAFYTVGFLRLSGTQSLIDRSVVIMNSAGTDILACATIKMLHDLKMSAYFSTGGFSGRVMFSQKAGFGQIPTMVSIDDLTGFSLDSHSLQIHARPMGSGSNPCSDLGDIYNPLGFSGQTGNSHDQYKVGDLSRRDMFIDWYDFNLPMKGPTSIISHTLAVLNQNNIISCASINFYMDANTKGRLTTAQLTFTGPLVGMVTITQMFYYDGHLSDTSIIVDLKDSDNSATSNHNWHVHVSPVKNDTEAVTGRCLSAGPHYDPFSAKIGSAATNYGTECGLLTPLRCEVGDQASKLGTYNLGSGAVIYNDVYLHLEGEYSVQGRSIVFHTENKGAPRLGCADIIPINGIELEVQFETSEDFDKREAAQTFANAINTETENIVVQFLSKTDGVTKINIHFLGKDRNILRSNFRSFINVESNRQTLGLFSSISEVGRSSHIVSSLALLLFSFIVGKLCV